MSRNGAMTRLPGLAKEIQEGRLRLRATARARFCFSFSVADFSIGIFGIESTGPNRVALLRRWNQEKQVLDPASGLYFLNRGRQFNRILPGAPLFLVEFTSDFAEIVSRVAFKAEQVRLLEADVAGAPEDFRFESVELSGLEIIG